MTNGILEWKYNNDEEEQITRSCVFWIWFHDTRQFDDTRSLSPHLNDIVDLQDVLN